MPGSSLDIVLNAAHPCGCCSTPSLTDAPVRGDGMGTAPGPNEEPPGTVALPWYRRPLTSLTLYDELCAAHISADFAPVRARLQQEWTFCGSFLLTLAGVDVAMFAITPNPVFKVNSYAYTAVSTSSAACSFGIACDMWFLLRYNCVDTEIFIRRCRDVYDSHVFFALSSRMPTFCMLVSSISLMAFLGLMAYEAWAVSVLVIGVFVFLGMILQFLVYGVHQSIMSTWNMWRIRAVPIVDSV